MTLRPQRSTRTDTLCPDTPHFRSCRYVRRSSTATRPCARRWRGRRGAKRSFLILPPPASGRGAKHCSLQRHDVRSEEHTSELQSLMRLSYAVFCLKKKKQKHRRTI